MKYWSNQKYHYKIINENNEVVAFIHGYLSEAEKFVRDSKMQMKSLAAAGYNVFEIKVTSDNAWKL